MIMYKANSQGKITAVEVERETKSQVVLISGRRESKRSDFYNWHKSWEEAKQFLIDDCNVNIDIINSQLHKEKTRLENIKSMKNTDGR